MKKIYKISIVITMFLVLLVSRYYVLGTTLSPNQMEFNVKFSGKPNISNSNKVVASILDSNNAIINIYDLNMKDNKESVTFIIQNTSRDLYANVTTELTNTNREYFSVDSHIEKTQLKNGEATKVTVNVELLKEPIDKTEISTIKIKLISAPVQPGQNAAHGSDGNTQNNNDKKDEESSSTEIKDFVDYYKKDETPKTGNSNFIDILRGF